MAVVFARFLKFCMEDVNLILSKAGLNNHEISLYMVLLRSGESPASVLSKKANIPRSTTRGILDRLCEKNLVSKIYKRNTQYYYCNPPHSLIELQKKTIEESELAIEKLVELMPLLSSFYDMKSVVPRVRVFQGADQVIEAFNLSLYEEGLKEILIFTSYQFLKNPLIRKNDDDFYIKMRVKKGISARVLVGRTDESSKMVKVAPTELRERRFIPDHYKLPGNIHIYGNNVLYFSTIGDDYIAVLVEGAMMASTMKALFEFMWENCN